MKLTGNNARAYLGFCDEKNVQTTGALKAGELYFIQKKGETTGLPANLPEGTFFRATAGVTVGKGGQFLKIEQEQLYKTSADFSMEQGVVDIGDDKDPGAKMLDGIVDISGSVSGIFHYNEATGKFADVTEKVIDKFLAVVREGDGNKLVYSPRDDSQVFLLLHLNADTNSQYENWLYVPIIVSSVSMSFGNTEAQTRELSWTKGEGEAVRYVRK